MFWEKKTWKTEETPCKKLIEKLIHLNKCLYPVTQSQRKNVWHLGFVSLAELALQSDGYIEICDTYRKKHRTTSVLPRHFDARDVTTQGQDPKHTRYHHLDFTQTITKWESDVFEIVDSVGMRFSILNAVCMRTTYDQAWMTVRESESSILHRHMHVYELSYMDGHVGLSLFAAIEEHTIEAYLVGLSPRTVWRSDLLDWKRRNKLEEWNDEAPCSRR